jgi:hypothetical protein
MWPFKLRPLPPRYEIRLKRNQFGGWYGQVYLDGEYVDEIYKLLPCLGSSQRAAARGARRLVFKCAKQPKQPSQSLVDRYSGKG